ncbi:MAG TPA: hypothetical protein VKR60_05585 [Candidatus Sulfotelmatobacter sp.]|nr:hypothetical protein [Candidatus Sulfotelmatobacter sp.]
MFEPHSLLWHYLWVAPSVLLLVVAFFFYQRSLYKELPVFLVFAVVQGVTVLALYLIDLMPFFSTQAWWKANWARLLVEVILKFALVGEIFSRVWKPYPALSKLGKMAIRGVGAALVLVATAVAALVHPGSNFWIVSGSHLLDLGDFMIECGLLAFIFLFAAYFHLAWERLVLGIALGRGISASVQLGSWALLANVKLSGHARNLFDFLNLAAYHLCVLIWLYYVLTTPKVEPSGALRKLAVADYEPSPEDERQKNLDVWNRELERLLHR